MKKIIGYLTLSSLLFSPILAFAHDEDEVYYSDEDDELFNRGKFVGQENDAYLKQRRYDRNKNWAIAIGTTAVGVATLILVGKNR